MSGFVRVASAIPEIKVGNCQYNANKIISQIKESAKKKASVVLFPELVLTGCTCGKLFHNKKLLDEAQMAIYHIAEETEDDNIISLVGMPLLCSAKVYNTVAVIYKGEIYAFISKPKVNKENDKWFSPLIHDEIIYAESMDIRVTDNCVFCCNDFKFSVMFDNIFLSSDEMRDYVNSGAEIVFNLAAFQTTAGLRKKTETELACISKEMQCGVVFASGAVGESTTDAVYDGTGYIFDNGELLAKTESFSQKSQIIYSEICIDAINGARINSKDVAINELQYISLEMVSPEIKKLNRKINTCPFLPCVEDIDERCEEILNIQATGLAKRFLHTHSKTLVIGVSGGLDSTLALLVCAHTFDMLKLDRKDIIGITMPGFGTTDRTYNNALEMMKSLGITQKEISIKDACIQHFKDIEYPENTFDVTYENSQARERTQILMDYANKVGGIVVGTGDLSELALGWATYNGDHMSMYGVNADVPKTVVRKVVRWYAEKTKDKTLAQTLINVVETPVSPELLPSKNGKINQKTEDLVGPYELHDFFIYYMLKYGLSPESIKMLACNAFAGIFDEATIEKWLRTFLRRFFNQQFKRSCMPDGPKVFDISLSPRGDWQMPSDMDNDMWINMDWLL